MQVTTAPNPDGGPLSSNEWRVIGDYPGSMGYDAASLVSDSCASCFIAGQPVWSGSLQPQKSIDVDLSEFDTVVVWCKRFSVAFTAADLA